MQVFRISEAAALLGVSDDTLRRWAEAGRVETTSDESGRRVIEGAALARFAEETAAAAERPAPRPVVSESARNRFAGVVTRIDKDRVAAVVEILAGPHRLVSLMTAEAVDEMGLRVGDEAIGVVKATNVIVEVPSPRDGR